MSQEKFVNTYIELLTSTVTESIQKNLILQAQKKISEQELVEVRNNLLENEAKKISEQNLIMSLKQEINDLKKEKNSILAEKGDEHIGTFKQELVRNKKLNEKLYAQIHQLNEELESKQKTIEDLTKEIAKLLKPEVEAKINAEKEVTEESGTF